MSATKTEFKWFDITMHEEEQAYLREMHQKGWRLQKMRWAFYTFEQCTPEDVVYQLDYNDKQEDRAAYLQMFADCGWEHIQDAMGYAYFRKPVAEMQDGEEEIFCDDESRLAMWNRIYRGRVSGLVVIFFALVLPQLLIQSMFDSPVNRVIFGVYVVIAVIYALVLGRFAMRYYKAKDKMGR